MKKVLILLLTLVMVFSMSAVAFAEGGTQEGATTYGLGDAKMTKDLTVADGIDISAVKTFTFSFTFDAENSVGYDATADASKLPTIAAQTIEVGTQENGHAYGNKALSAIFTDATAFPHAGVYAYKVKETTAAINTTENGITKTLTVDATEYIVRLYVTNGTDGLVFSGVTVEKAGEKVDPTIKEGEKTSGFNFKNEYKEVIEEDENGVLTITKTITGAYADKTKTFPVSVTLTIPSTASESDVQVAQGATLNGLTATADLTNNGTIKFTKLPAGTTFKVSETQDAAYKSKITGFVKTEDSAYVEGNRTDVEGKEPITASGKTVTIENNREDVIPTGVIIHNLPYLMLVLVAVLGLAYLALKRRACK